jgi:O-glycosyl hydrolase
MVSVGQNASSPFVVTPYYYLIKHFSKNIDAGYHRVEASASKASVLTSAFISPDNATTTMVIINDGALKEEVTVMIKGKTVTGRTTCQSTSGTYYKNVEMSSPEDAITLPPKSITTIVLRI